MPNALSFCREKKRLIQVEEVWRRFARVKAHASLKNTQRGYQSVENYR
jgi:hypothetical protein